MSADDQTVSHADEGYRLTYGGYDFLACRTFAKRDTIYSVGNQIGTGKESGAWFEAHQRSENRVEELTRVCAGCRYLRRRGR